MKCCDGSGCHNYPFGAYFTCQNNGGTISGRSVDSEEEKPARKLGLWMPCNSNSDCESGRCAGRVGKECLPARSRSVDSGVSETETKTETDSLLARLTNLFSSGRSVDSEEEKPARKLGLWMSCNSNSDCESGRCAGRVGSSSAATNTATKHSPAWPATTTAPVKDTLAEPAPRRVATAARADYGIKTEAGSLVRAEFGKKCTFPTPIWTNTPIFFFFDSNRENLNFLASVIFFRRPIADF